MAPEASDVPSEGRFAMGMVTVVEPMVRLVSVRLGSNCKVSSMLAALTAFGDVASMAAGMAAARGRAKAAVPLRPRNFLREISLLLILQSPSSCWLCFGPPCGRLKVDG